MGHPEGQTRFKGCATRPKGQPQSLAHPPYTPSRRSSDDAYPTSPKLDFVRRFLLQKTRKSLQNPRLRAFGMRSTSEFRFIEPAETGLVLFRNRRFGKCLWSLDFEDSEFLGKGSG